MVGVPSPPGVPGIDKMMSQRGVTGAARVRAWSGARSARRSTPRSPGCSSANRTPTRPSNGSTRRCDAFTRTDMLRTAQRRIILPFLLPAALLLSVFFLYPLVRTVGISMSDWTRTGASKYVGGRQLHGAARRPGLSAVAEEHLPARLRRRLHAVPAGSGDRLGAEPADCRGERFFRFLIFAPVVLSVAVVALMWKFIFHPTLGLINPAMAAIGLGDLARCWLGDPLTALARGGVHRRVARHRHLDRADLGGVRAAARRRAGGRPGRRCGGVAVVLVASCCR